MCIDGNTIFWIVPQNLRNMPQIRQKGAAETAESAKGMSAQ
jgi:hypothetical protein